MKQNLSIFDDTYHKFVNIVSLSQFETLEKIVLIFIFRS